MQTLSFVFDTGGTLGSYAVLTQGVAASTLRMRAVSGAAYSAGATCTVSVTFTPRFPCLRYGAVTLKNNSGAVIATAYLVGVGIGSQVDFTPGALATFADNGTQCLASTRGVATAERRRVLTSPIQPGLWRTPPATSTLPTPTTTAFAR